MTRHETTAERPHGLSDRGRRHRHISFALFGTALEVLKFMALIKWIFA